MRTKTGHKSSDYSKLRESFSSAHTADGSFAQYFYQHLFALDPSLERQFENVDMATQGAMVLQAVRVALDGLEDFDQVRAALESLGRRHLQYGVRPDQYDTAAEAFVRALGQTLGERFDDSLESIWRETLSSVTGSMIAGADRDAADIPSARKVYQAGRESRTKLDAYTARFMPKELEMPTAAHVEVSAADLPSSFNVDYVGEKSAVAAPLQTILDVSLQNNISHVCVCGAIGRCSTCRVAVLDGLDQCLPRNQVEARMATLKGFSSEIRLACQTRLIGPIVLKRLVHDESDVHEAADVGSDQVGREMPLAVMFVDIRGFTPFAESNLPYDVVHALNRYFDVVGKAVDERDGYIDKYIGDGIMVLFGLSRERDDHPCVDAVHAALDATIGMRSVNEYLGEHLGRTFQIAIGIHYGPGVVGEIGYKLKRQFTAIGDVVNTAARLEEEAKRQNVGVLITDEVLRELPPNLCSIGRSMQLTLRGKSDAKTAYEIMPTDGDASPA
jgi:class 3 adenylate cyclase/hemoglobin-like flavoprotein